MQAAIEQAKTGQGFVEPNPMVGCVLVRDGKIIGQGAHEKFGGPHAEINAIESVEPSGDMPAEGSTAYVTLEPCSHTGKTGPCTQALINAKVARVVVACEDPNPLVGGKGIEQLRAAGIEVATGVQARSAEYILAPYLKRMKQGKPWVIAKWAMTLDGKIATPGGDSKWISNEDSRAIVHGIRGRVDGVMVGVGTAISDDPMLNARPPGARSATRIVVDSTARIGLDLKLTTTTNQFDTLIATGPKASDEKCKQLEHQGCSIFRSESHDANQRLLELLTHLARQGMTNILVEGGSRLLGSLHDLNQIDEIHVFIGPKLLGGDRSLSPVGGAGYLQMADSSAVNIEKVERLGHDIYIVGRKLT